MNSEEAGKVFVDATAYADERRFHDATTHLRQEDPVHWADEPGFLPFWALTRHADVMAVERDNTLFLSAPRPLLQPAEFDLRERAEGRPIRTLIHMDEPDHRAYRAVASDWFRPRQMANLEDRVKVLATRFVDHMADMGGAFDVERHPNNHLAFGIGPHFCLGAQLARMETRVLFNELVSRVETVELAGEPASSTVFVGGLKRLPIRYRMS